MGYLGCALASMIHTLLLSLLVILFRQKVMLQPNLLLRMAWGSILLSVCTIFFGVVVFPHPAGWFLDDAQETTCLAMGV